MKNFKLFTMLVMASFVIQSYGLAYAPESLLFNQEKLTPSTPVPDTYAKPYIFPKTNNLRRKPGSPFIAKGEYLLIKGQVMDLMGVPIENAVVKIWQANHFGYYNHLVPEEDLDKFDVDFLYAGICVTDNFGYYAFTTIMPGSYGDRAPHIHMMIEVDGFEPLETELFFPDHPRNKNDKKYNSLSLKKRELLTIFLQNVNPEDPTAGKVATFNIRLDGLHRHKTY